MSRASSAEIEHKKAAALTKAALDCAHDLGLSPDHAAKAIGVTPGALTAMRKGERVVDGMNGEAERADALVRVGKRLRALLGDAETAWRSWLRREYGPLGAKPLDVMLQRDGVMKVAAAVERAHAL